MQKISILEIARQLKTKFQSYRQDKKKIAALDNFSSVSPFRHRKFLFLLKHCLKDAFLGQKEEDFLNHLLDVYSVKYLDWAHKTPWLKRKMYELRAKSVDQPQIFFDFEKISRPAVHIPVHLIKHNRSIERRAP